MNFEQRIWQKLYDPGLPADIRQEYGDMLSLFAAAVRRCPDEPAVLYFDGRLTFREVDELSDRIAMAFLEEGLEAGQRVVMVLQNVPQFMLVLLAAWKTGAIVVPANPMYKAREFEFILEDCEPAIVVLQDEFYQAVAADVLKEKPVGKVFLTAESFFQSENDPRVFSGAASVDGFSELMEEVASRPAGAVPPLTLSPQDTATIVYTSGTTGKPKGAMHSHSNLAFNAQVSREWLRAKVGEPNLAIAPLFHITGLVGNLCSALLCVTPLVLYRRFVPDMVLDEIRRHRPTMTVAPITALIALMNVPGVRPEDFSSFKLVMSGGAPVPPAVRDALREKLGLVVRNAYGMTETSATVTITPTQYEGPVDPRYGALSIGVPVFNTEIKIVDDQGREVSAGEEGELLIKGPQVISGYWRRPDDQSISDGWISTGDIATIDKEGWIYLIDRKKDVIIASGYKVWPRDVEDVLYTHPQVREVAVVPAQDPYRGETVRAIVSLTEGATVTSEDLMAYCKERMAAYKYPRIVDIMADLPKTPTGKILRRALKDTPVAEAASGS